jgi:single-strand DNA-binding protein
MASDINSVTIVGRMTRDAELKYTNSGQPVTKFSIANNYSKKNGDNWEELTNFFDVTLWGKRGESLNQYLTKGTQLAVTGELKQDRWEQDGQQRSRVLINANNIQLLGGNKQGGQQSNNQQSYSQPQNNQQPSNANNGNFEDFIPF